MQLEIWTSTRTHADTHTHTYMHKEKKNTHAHTQREHTLRQANITETSQHPFLLPPHTLRFIHHHPSTNNRTLSRDTLRKPRSSPLIIPCASCPHKPVPDLTLSAVRRKCTVSLPSQSQRVEIYSHRKYYMIR